MRRASLSPSGQLKGTIIGANGQTFAMESSTNLAKWTALTNVTITNGTAQFTDPSVPGLGRRFYKAEMNLQ
jgi:hypothetical protein